MKYYFPGLERNPGIKIPVKMTRDPGTESLVGIVYKLSCSDCDVLYNGKTDRLLKERTEEHRKDVDKSKVTSQYTFMFS